MQRIGVPKPRTWVHGGHAVVRGGAWSPHLVGGACLWYGLQGTRQYGLTSLYADVVGAIRGVHRTTTVTGGAVQQAAATTTSPVVGISARSSAMAVGSSPLPLAVALATP